MRPTLLVALCLLLAGCMQPYGPGTDRRVLEVEETERLLVLDYTLTNHQDERRNGEPGGHCPAAFHNSDHVQVQQFAMERARQGAHHGTYLLVEPALRGNWSGDHGAVFHGLPAKVDARIDVPFGDRDGGEPWTTIDAETDRFGAVFVDDAVVTLPHHWVVAAPDGSWRIDARLTAGPRNIQVIEDLGCD